MTNYVAQIEDGRVARVILAGDDHDLDETEVMIGADTGVRVGWLWDGKAFAPPPAKADHRARR